MAEFAYNNVKTLTIKITPFYANYGYYLASLSDTGAITPIRNPASQIQAHWARQIQDDMRRSLEAAREAMKKYADRRQQEAPTYEAGQYVILNSKHIKTRRPTPKLAAKILGPFKILKVISPTAIKLILPPSWRIHNTFHVSLVEPYRVELRGPPNDS